MSDRRIDALAEAVIDGDPVDWSAAFAALPASVDRQTAAQLHALSTVQTIRPNPATASARKLPIAVELGRSLAIVCAILGALLELVGAGHVLFGLVVVAFGGAAAYLDIGGSDRRTRALATCYWMVAASFSTAAFKWLGEELGWPAWLRVLTGLRPEVFFAAALWQFAREFPKVMRFSYLDRLCQVALRVAISVGLVLFAVNVAIAISPASDLSRLAAPLNGMTAGIWYWNSIFGLALPAVVIIGLRARHAEGTEERRARFFLYAIAASFLPIVLEVLAEGFFPSYRRVVRTPTGQLIGSLIIYPLQILLPFVTAYAVVVDHVLDVRVLIQHALRYLLAKALIAWGAAIPIVALAIYAFRHSEESLSAVFTSGQATLLIWFSAAAVVLLLARPALMRALDRLALPGFENEGTTLARMTDALKDTRTLSEVLTVLTSSIERALQAPAEAYVLRDSSWVPLRPGAEAPPEETLIPLMLEGARVPCLVGPGTRASYYSLLTHGDRSWIARRSVAMMMPILAGRGRKGLVGIIALNSRRNALTFSVGDRRFLHAGAGAASMTVDLIEAESDPGALDVGEKLDELALQCSSCGAVTDVNSHSVPCPCGGNWRQAALPLRVAQRFQLASLLGAGGMGIVYRATDLRLKREVAVKTLTKLSEEAADRLIIEARTMAGLSHPNIAVLYATEMWRGTPILVMEYLAGGTLAQRLGVAPLPLAEALAVALSLARSLEHLHRDGLYHGDIKPSNIGFTKHGTPKFLDFGLSRAVASDFAGGGPGRPFVGGTLPYLSPEVRNGAPAGPALDVWAFAIVFCECLTGRHPFPTATAPEHFTNGVARILREHPAAFPPRVGDFMVRALSPLDDREPTTAAGLVSAVVALGERHTDSQ